MKIKSLGLITLAFIALASGRLAAAETMNSEATVTKVTGQAMVQMPGQSDTIAVAVGMKVPQGATITTKEGEVFLQAHTGTVATIKANSVASVEALSVTTDGGKVTKETTSLNLRSGNVVSMLDPAKKSVNSYQVRTPKGVAAARGTTFTVSYNGVNYTIVATSGNVVITSSTGQVVSISGGQASLSSNGGAATNVADLPAAEKAEVIQAMAVAVATIAVAAEQGMLGDAATAAAQLADATQTVIAAAPEAAASITALVQVSAPTQAATVQQAIETAPPPATPPPATPPAPSVTTPQPIDPTTVSRSG